MGFGGELLNCVEMENAFGNCVSLCCAIFVNCRFRVNGKIIEEEDLDYELFAIAYISIFTLFWIQKYFSVMFCLVWLEIQRCLYTGKHISCCFCQSAFVRSQKHKLS